MAYTSNNFEKQLHILKGTNRLSPMNASLDNHGIYYDEKSETLMIDIANLPKGTATLRISADDE